MRVNNIQTVSADTISKELMITVVNLIKKWKSQNFLLAERRMSNKKLNTVLAQHRADKV